MAKTATAARKRAANKAGRKTGETQTPEQKQAAIHVAETPAKVKPLGKKAQLAADVAALSAAQDATDTSFVITDYNVLRERAVEAMGAFANEAKPATEILEAWTKRKAGAANTHIFMVHPLSLDVDQSEIRLNSRDFTSVDMVERVADMTHSVAGGVNVALQVFVRGDRFVIVGGETRLRGVLHAWILKAADPARRAPVGIPITLEAAGVNDAKRHLNVALSNDQKTMKPIELAQKYYDAHRSGMSVEDIAAYMFPGKSQQSAGVHVESYLAMLEMPEAVLNVVRRGQIAISLAKRWWDDEGRDTDKTLARIASAEKQRQRTGASHIMPKHDEATPKTTGSGRNGGTRQTVNVEALRRNHDTLLALLANALTVRHGDFVDIRLTGDDFEIARSIAPMVDPASKAA